MSGNNVLQISSRPANEVAVFTPEQEETIKKTVAKGATKEEFDMFAYLCNKYGLDPFLKEIWFFKRPKKEKNAKGQWDYPRTRDGEVDYSKAETIIMASRDGFLKVAQGNPEYVGPPISFVVCEGDQFEVDAEAFKVTHKFGAKRGQKLGAWAKIERKGKTPAICFVPFAEYNNGSNVWTKNPSAMIQKVAEVFVLKRQFGISGLVAQEEYQDEDNNYGSEEVHKQKKSVIDITPEPQHKPESEKPPKTVTQEEQLDSSTPVPETTQESEKPKEEEQKTPNGEKEKPELKSLGTREFTLLGAKMKELEGNKTLWILAVDLGDGRKSQLYLDPAKAEEFEGLGVQDGDKVKIKIAQSNNSIIAQEIEVVK